MRVKLVILLPGTWLFSLFFRGAVKFWCIATAKVEREQR